MYLYILPYGFTSIKLASLSICKLF